MKRTKTLKVRVRDKHAKRLNDMARSVNFVWNYVNELSERAIRERGLFLSGYDLHAYTKGAHNDLGLHNHTLQRINMEYATRRRKARKRRLAWRKSSGARRSLGWIPINTGQAKWKHGQLFHNGHYSTKAPRDKSASRPADNEVIAALDPVGVTIPRALGRLISVT
ncbi:MAG: hypothetical protein PF501_03770 [Salinisphaera sp.]|jgi:putative transposase|nr:hypothetical protein [Salinisphaera sp.]